MLFHSISSITICLFGFLFMQEPCVNKVEASLIMKRLYEDLFTDYNKLIIPIAPNRTKVVIKLGLKLGQILDLNLKQQILSTNVWVEQAWHDHRLEWDPHLYDEIDMIHVPAENIWIPDIVLFNNADGNYELTLVAKARLYSNGTVVWKPPTMFRSTCEIDVEYFPFDIQTCFLRFGSWTYAGDEVEIRHVNQLKRKVDIGIDLSQFYKNVEWDIIDVPAYYNENYYDCCQEPYPDITFKIVIRRKMLFYLVNLILPVALMTFMTVSVFYLPADSNEKVTLSISILTSLIVFFLLMLEAIPPTSLAVPLFGKYLLFTLVLVSLSACVSVYVLNIHHRAPSVHQMSPRMRQLFLKTLPRLLRLDRPDPRERSSLNRFRKKKIAQQILQARQNNKVYDLAQPLAASLNLIEALHKGYDAKQADDDDSGKGKRRTQLSFSSSLEGDEQGRYFRRYVDEYIEQLEAHEANERNSVVRSNEKQVSSQRQASLRSRHSCASELRQAKLEPREVCCQNSSLRRAQAEFRMREGDQFVNFQAVPQLAQRPGASAPTSCSLHFDGYCKECLLKANQQVAAPFGNMLHDDTLDMTFDYEDQEQEQVPATSGHHQQALDEQLPSPPPPPRQLTQLSDSMKDLSARVVASGAHGSHQLRFGESSSRPLDEHLVDKLFSSINLINNASDEMDATTTTTNSTTAASAVRLTSAACDASMARQENLSPGHSIDESSFDESLLIGQPNNTTSRLTTQASCSCATRRPMVSSETYNSLPKQPPLYNSTKSNGHTKTAQATPVLGPQQPSDILLSLRLPYDQMPAHVRAAIRSILFIADTIKNEDDENSAIEDWESVSMVVDRLFLWIFFILCTIGSLIILALAPSLYDQRDSIDDKLRIDIPPSNCSAISTFTE